MRRFGIVRMAVAFLLALIRPALAQFTPEEIVPAPVLGGIPEDARPS